MTEAAIIAALSAVRFNCQGEDELQEAIAKVLLEAAIAFRREYPLTAKERIDFLVGSVGVEVKVDGSTSAIARQLQRYAACPEVASLMLVTPRFRYGALDGVAIGGKVVKVVRLVGGLL